MILAEYASWLKRTHLEDLALRNLEMLKQMDLPLLKQFEHLPDDKLVEILKPALAEFLESIANGTAWDHLKQTMNDWENDNLKHNISKYSIQPSDIILANNAQSRAVITFLPEYTDKSDEAMAIVNEFSEYYSKAQKLGFETLTGIRQKSEESFHLLVSSIRDVAIFRLDTRGYIQSWNPGAERLKGYTEQEIIGRHFSIFYPEEDIKDGKPERELEIVIAEGRYEEEGWRVRKDQSRFWAKVVITPIYESDGRLFGFAKLTHDLTERLSNERSLVRKNQELSRYISDTAQFARITAHELKEPLHVISTFITVLQKNYRDGQNPDAVAARYRQTILEKTHLMQHQLNAMQEFMSISVLNTGGESADLNTVLGRVKALLAREIKESGAQITYDALPVLPYPALHMTTLFRNLVDNAIKFRRKDGVPEIRIAAELSDDNCLLSVKDNALPIEKEYREKIFEMFRRLHGPKVYPGVGMGLAICKKIVELSGGKIWVESQPLAGNTFFITLPSRTANQTA